MKLLILMFLFNILFIVKSRIIKRDVTSLTSTEKIYLDKICKNEPTCNMIEQVSKDLRTAKVRNCMCDAECAIYGDCCVDSTFYNIAEQRLIYDTFRCADEGMYIKKSCPADFADVNTKLKCETGAERRYRTTDLQLVVPVTDMKSKISYENEYCARCNGVSDFVGWKTSYWCWPRNYVENVTDVGIGPDGKQSDDVAKNVIYNITTGIFETDYKGVYFTCNQYINPTSDVEPVLRKCVRSIVTCSGSYDEQTATQCKSFTSIVYDGFIGYRNKYCAVCNGVKGELPGCIKQVNYEHVQDPIILNSTISRT